MTETKLDVVEAAVARLLDALGQDRRREGLSETPRRMARMLMGLLEPEPFAFTTFDSEGLSEMVVQHGIPFFSLCEHHVVPFFGTATVAYLPNGKIAGLSKLARAVRYCAAGLQNQERMTRAVADVLSRNLATPSVGVVVTARHLCMEMRGVRTHDVHSSTSDLRGAFREDARCRAEFLALARGAAR